MSRGQKTYTEIPFDSFVIFSTSVTIGLCFCSSLYIIILKIDSFKHILFFCEFVELLLWKMLQI